MANNFTQFSFMIDATKEHRDWILTVHSYCSAADGSPDDKPLSDPRYATGITLMEQCIAGDLAPSVFLEPTKDGLWLYAEEGGDPEYTASLLSAFLEAFRLDTVLSFTWADTCSKMRLDEFGGGAVVITKDETRFLSPSMWIDEQVAQITASRVEA